MKHFFLLTLQSVLAEKCPRERRIDQSGLPTLSLYLNDLSQSASGICHYHLKTDDGGNGAISIDPDGSKKGYMTSKGRTFSLSSSKRQELTSSLFTFQNHCHKEYETPSGAHLEFNPRNQTRKRRDNEDKYIELIIVVTKDLVTKYEDNNGTDLTSKLRPVFSRYERVHNTIDSFYKTAGIRVALLDIVLWTDSDKIDLAGKNSGEILDEFRTWRRTQHKNMDLTGDSRKRWKAHDNAQLVVPRDTFENPTIGKGWTNAFCESYSAGVNEDHQDSFIGLATTMAHEMGHNVGLNHDASGCTCERGSTCIMAASSSPSNPASKWSSCSQERLLERKEEWPCMDDVPDPKLLHGTANCGNGIVERGEDCDCGDKNESECTACCNKATCKFKAGADCSDVNGPCCKNCRLQAGGTVCRGAKGDCDLPEYCSGYSPQCPANVFVRNGEECGAGRCMSGSCVSQDGHCAYLYGAGSVANIDCMKEKNTHHNDAAGNCGESFSRDVYYSRCRTEQDALCGKVNCDGGPDYSVVPELEDVDVAFNGENGQCKYMDWRQSHTADSGNQFYNIDRMPMGAPCGPLKVCVPAQGSHFRSECQHLSSLWTEDEWGTCSKNCSGHGICNSNGNCHCDDKYGGEGCDEKGYGGSIDSNRANYSVRDDGTVMFASIFAVLFALVVVAALIAKFHFGRNLTDICYYQPCAGNKAPRNRSPPTRGTPRTPPSDPFNNPDWGTGEQIYVEVTDKSYITRQANEKPPKYTPQRPPLPSQNVQPVPVFNPPAPAPNTSDPFRADWSDEGLNSPAPTQRPLRVAPPPPAPPALPPKDY